MWCSLNLNIIQIRNNFDNLIGLSCRRAFSLAIAPSRRVAFFVHTLKNAKWNFYQIKKSIFSCIFRCMEPQPLVENTFDHQSYLETEEGQYILAALIIFAVFLKIYWYNFRIRKGTSWSKSA